MDENKVENKPENKVDNKPVVKQSQQPRQQVQESQVYINIAYANYRFSRSTVFALEKKFKKQRKTMKEWQKIFAREGLI